MPEVRTVEANGTTLSYVEAGSGPETVVFVHGSLDDYRSWRYQMEPFAERLPGASRYSRRYHYPNAWDRRRLRILGRAARGGPRRLDRSVDGAAGPPGHLVLRRQRRALLASQRPELVRSLVLGEPPLLPWLAYIPGGKAHAQRFLDEAWLPAREAFAAGRLEDGARLFLDGVMGRPTFQHLGRRGYQMIMDNAPEMRAETLREPTTSRRSAAQRRRRSPSPVLLCKGERSPRVVPHDHRRPARQCLPGTRPPVVIPGASHAMHVGNPAAYNQVVLDFLADFLMHIMAPRAAQGA